MKTDPKRSASPKTEKKLGQKFSFRKILKFLFSLSGRKTKKSFFSIISHVLDSYQKEGLIAPEEKKMFKNMASFSDKKVASIMTPRVDLIAIKHDASLEEVKQIITQDGHTRIPVFRENLDEIIGFIHSKDLAKFLCKEQDDFAINKILRKILFVSGSMKLLDLMLRMRMARVHAAIVLDEFGGVDGLVTIENLMEEIVGDIEDEHDLPSENPFLRIKKINENSFEIGGRVEIEKAEEALQIKIKKDDDDFETVGGLVIALFKRVPEVGEEVKKDDIKFKVVEADKRTVKAVEVTL